MVSSIPDQTERQLRELDAYEDELLLAMYRTMYAIRAFEYNAAKLSEDGELPGSIHLYLGQEAVAVGTCLAIGEDDFIGSTHRGHGHVLAKGADIDRMMAELAGKETGLNSGRGGSMHMVDFSLGIFGCNAIVGASVPHVVGGALSAQIDGEPRVGVAFFGDGAANEGVVHESMNVAGIWDLPVVFLCENNQYAVSTSADYSVAGGSVAARAAGYGMSGTTVDGQDVLAVYDAVSEAVEAARNGEGPHVIECETLRYSGHFSGEQTLQWLEDAPYRPGNRLEEWKEEKDPIETFRTALEYGDIASASELDDVQVEVDAELDDAVAFALDSDFPAPETAANDVYTNQSYPNLPAPRYR